MCVLYREPSGVAAQNCVWILPMISIVMDNNQWRICASRLETLRGWTNTYTYMHSALTHRQRYIDGGTCMHRHTLARTQLSLAPLQAVDCHLMRHFSNPKPKCVIRLGSGALLINHIALKSNLTLIYAFNAAHCMQNETKRKENKIEWMNR